MMAKLKVGVVGCGIISTVHIPIILQSQILVAVCDSNLDLARLTGEKYGCRYYQHYAELFDNEEMDVVHILTPHNVRSAIVKLATEKGIHLIIEKPLAHTYEEAEKIVSLVEKSNINATVIYQNRSNNSYRQLKAELNKESCGRILGMEATVFWRRDMDYYQASPWRGIKQESGGGLLINQAIHTIDWLQDIGGEIKELSAQIFRLKNRQLDIEDSACFTAGFANGVQAFFSGTLCNVKNSAVTLKVFCEQGNYIIREGALYLLENGTEKMLAVDDRGTVKDYYGASHQRVIEGFWHALRQQVKSPLTVSEALKSLKIVTDIYNKGDIL